MTRFTSSKTFWRWVTLLGYVGILMIMGYVRLHRSHPAIFFSSLLILTLVLILLFKFIYRGENEP
jgi:hypothetical protein